MGRYCRQQTSNIVALRTLHVWDYEAEWRLYASVNYPPLVQIMTCRLVSTKPLSEPMVEYCQLGPQEQSSEISVVNQTFSFKKLHLRISYAKWRPFSLGLNVLIVLNCINAHWFSQQVMIRLIAGSQTGFKPKSLTQFSNAYMSFFLLGICYNQQLEPKSEW